MAAELWQIEMARDGYLEAKNPERQSELTETVDDFGSILRGLKDRAQNP